MKIIRIIASAIIVVVITVVGYVYSGHYDVSATSTHSRLAQWVMSTTMHESVQRRAKDIKVPNLDDEALQLAGINDFDSMCATCHGTPGREPGAIGQGLNPPAPDLQESADHSTTAELFWVTKNGIKMTGMPAWSASHDDEALWPVVAFMTILPGLNPDTYQSMLSRAKGSGHHAEDQPTQEEDQAQQDKPHSHDNHDH